MSDDPGHRVYIHAMGLAEAMTKATSGVDELVTVAGGDEEVLEAALQRAESEAQSEAGEVNEPVSDGGSDAPASDAPALLARRLLRQALEHVQSANS
jgi:hypothetical protein